MFSSVTNFGGCFLRRSILKTRYLRLKKKKKTYNPLSPPPPILCCTCSERDMCLRLSRFSVRFKRWMGGFQKVVAIIFYTPFCWFHISLCLAMLVAVMSSDRESAQVRVRYYFWWMLSPEKHLKNKISSLFPKNEIVPLSAVI